MVYLADVVSGAVVHRATHRHACGPVNIVLSENWVVVSGRGFVYDHAHSKVVLARYSTHTSMSSHGEWKLQ